MVRLTLQNATVGEAVLQIVRQANVSIWYSNSEFANRGKITLNTKEISVDSALHKILIFAGLKARNFGNNFWVIVPVSAKKRNRIDWGTITGRIVDAKTGKPLTGVSVSIMGSNIGASTNSTGQYRLERVGLGEQQLLVRRLGYVRKFVSISVPDSEVTLNIKIEPTTLTLDQVVVTGTVIPTERRSIPNAMTVITGKELTDRGINTLDQLFRGDVPGVFAVTTANSSNNDVAQIFSRGGTSIYVNGASQKTSLKIYVDGVELTDPGYINRIDPATIDRIELLPGPQASTIYGSGAIGGVMQVFTKRGGVKPVNVDAAVTMGSVAGLLGNTTARNAPLSNTSLQISTSDDRTALALGGRLRYLGAWTPGRTTVDLGGNVAVRRQLTSTISSDLSAVVEQHRIGGGISSQAIREAMSAVNKENILNGVYAYVPATAIGGAETNRDQHTAIGLTTTYTPASWLAVQLRYGTDAITGTQLNREPVYSTAADTMLASNQSSQTKTQGGVNVTVNSALGPHLSSGLVVGADGWYNTATSVSAISASNTGTLGDQLLTSTRQVVRDFGMFAQWQLSVLDAVTVVGGIRGERNSSYGKSYGMNVAPRFGASALAEIGPVTGKIRVAYGRSTQIPSVDLRRQLFTTDVTYGLHLTQLASPDLGPAEQSGPEGGLELYFGQRGSIDVTLYRQKYKNIYFSLVVDSIRSLAPGGGGLYSYFPIQQFMNVGSLRNDGASVTGTFNLGPVALRGVYTVQKSIIDSYTDGFQSYTATHTTTTYLLGEGQINFPTHLMAASAAYGIANTRLETNLNYVGKFPVPLASTLYSNRYRLSALQPIPGVLPDAFRTSVRSQTTVDLHLLQRLRPTLDFNAHVRNVGNTAPQDVAFTNPTIGRQFEAGLAIHR